jgi:hypothetical protein
LTVVADVAGDPGIDDREIHRAVAALDPDSW